jgi:hypothetical protein
MNVLKHIIISTILIMLIGCSSVPANSGKADTAVPTTASNPDIQCVQEGLNRLGHDAGAENGLINQDTKAALDRLRDKANASVPILTEKSAAGNCDVLRRRTILFEVIIDGESDVELGFRLYPAGNINAGTAPSAETSIISGKTQYIFIGERQMTNVRQLCILAPSGYGFNNAAGDTFIATCEQYEEAEITSAGSRVGYWATLVKR